MLVPGGTPFLRQDSVRFLWKNILQVKWLFQAKGILTDTFQHANDLTNSHRVSLRLLKNDLFEDRLNIHSPLYDVYLLKPLLELQIITLL